MCALSKKGLFVLRTMNTLCSVSNYYCIFFCLVGADIDPVEGRIVISAGETSSQVLFLEPRVDGLFEGVNETFEIVITQPSGQIGAVIINDRATVTIEDQDCEEHVHKLLLF